MLLRWLLGLMLALAVAAPASAGFRCRDWDNLEDGAKQEAILAEIEAVITGNNAKKYSVNTVQIRQCLQRRTPAIRDQFDGICLEGMSAAMNALDKEFEAHLFTCVGSRRPY
jgi:hypothetical protein